jgi:hypothetical protein
MRGVKRIKLRRSKMWRDDPHCRRCRILTVLPEDVDVKALEKAGQSDHLATIDHVVTKYDAEQRRNPAPGERRWRLLCRRCNNDLAREREMQVPIEERRRRSQRHPGSAA